MTKQDIEKREAAHQAILAKADDIRNNYGVLVQVSYTTLITLGILEEWLLLRGDQGKVGRHDYDYITISQAISLGLIKENSTI